MAKEKKPKSKEKKERDFTFYGFNIKIKSKRSPTDLSYYQLIRKVYASDVAVNVGGERTLVLRLAWTQTLRYNGKPHRLFYGKITRFTAIDGTNWYNKKTKQYENVNIPLNVFPNAYETDFIFVPKAHRFFIKWSPKISVKAVHDFLIEAFNQVKGKDQIVSVNVIADQNKIDEIINADLVTNLSVTVSYTNDDIGDAAQKLIDEMLKKANIGQAEANFKPDAQGSLNTKEDLVLGFLELAKENGEADATIIQEGKKRRIITRAHPEKLVVKSVEDDVKLLEAFFGFVMKNWKRG